MLSRLRPDEYYKDFLDKQKDQQQTDSPTASRPGFRLACQFAANNEHDLYHIDLKTAFLQGEAYDDCRDVICQLPPEAGYPPYIAARLKRPAYGLNDAPRRWWNIIDKGLRSYGMAPTRATVAAMFSIRTRVSELQNKLSMSWRTQIRVSEQKPKNSLSHMRRILTWTFLIRPLTSSLIPSKGAHRNTKR